MDVKLLELINLSQQEINSNRHREEQDNKHYLNLVSYVLNKLK